MREVVQELISKGHQVIYSSRKDGGILIRYIDGKHYTGAKGNTAARSMTGQELSQARAKQLKYATQVRKHPVKVNVSDAIKEEYDRVKKLWDKAFKSKKGIPHPAGYFGWKRIKTSVKYYGEAEALRRISEAEKYASGIAYSKNVKQLAGFILFSGEQYQSEELKKLAQDLTDNAYAIKEEWIYPAYERLYDLNKGHDPKQIAQDVRKILRL